MQTRYNVYFAGQLLEGYELPGVREKLAKLFNADQQTLDKLFSGKAQLLKRDCDETTAQKYKQAMERAGAQPIIKAAETAAAEQTPPPEPALALAPAPAPAPAPEETMTAAQRIAALAAAPDEAKYRADRAPVGVKEPAPTSESTGISLAPAGTDVLREDERTEPATREVDTAGLAVDATAQRLSEEPPPPPAAPDTSHLDMGAVGEMIPNLPSDQEPLSPDIDALALSPEGTDFGDCAAPDPEAPPLDLSGMDLAPQGADVLDEKYRKREQVKAPAIDHISLED